MGKKRKDPPAASTNDLGNDPEDSSAQSPAKKKMLKAPSKGSSAKRLIVVLENAQLESGKVGKTMELLCADKHGTFLRKNGKDPSVYRPDITHQVWPSAISVFRFFCASLILSVRWSVTRLLTAEFEIKLLIIKGKVKEWLLGNLQKKC